MTARLNRIHVLHLIGSLEAGGAERVLVDLVQRMPEHICSSIAVWTSCTDLQDELQDGGVSVIPLEAGGRWDVSAFRRLKQALSDRRPDILQTHLMRMHIAGRLAVSPHDSVRVLTTHHNMARGNSLVLRVLERATRFRAWYHVAVSPRAELSYFGTVGAGEKPIRGGHCTIPNGVCVERFQQHLTRDVNDSEAGYTFLCVGRLHPVKGHARLIDAMGLCRAEAPDVRLVIAGDGPERVVLEDQVRRQGLEDGITFLGFCKDISGQMAQADALVSVSTLEGFGMAVAEGMAAGLPVIATAVGAAPELVADLATGRLLPADADAEAIATAMRWMMEARGRARQCGAAGRRRVEDAFSIHRMVSRYETLYEALVPRRAGGRDV